MRCSMYNLGRADVSSWNKVSGSTFVRLVVTWHGICIDLRHTHTIVLRSLCRVVYVFSGGQASQRDYKEQILSYKCPCYFSLLLQQKAFLTLLLCLINIPNGE